LADQTASSSAARRGSALRRFSDGAAAMLLRRHDAAAPKALDASQLSVGEMLMLDNRRERSQRSILQFLAGPVDQI
jgi:hypothetical protein